MQRTIAMMSTMQRFEEGLGFNLPGGLNEEEDLTG